MVWYNDDSKESEGVSNIDLLVVKGSCSPKKKVSPSSEVRFG